MSFRWEDIKPFNNSQNYAFEELVCQLAREEDIEGKKEFYRVAAPDGGVEAYCILEDGNEYGWQAKYFFSMGSSQWQQLRKSFETALKTHPNLKKYIICLPLDRQDPRHLEEKWFMDRWNEKVAEWTDYAKAEDREVGIVYWGSSELAHRLSQEKNAGRKFFWFSGEEFSDQWFKSHVETSISDLGKRYTPELNVELEIARNFDAISRNNAFRQFIKESFHVFLLDLNKVLNSLRRFPFRDEINLISAAINNIEKAFLESQSKELVEIDTDSLDKSIEIIERALSECDKNIELDKKDRKESFDYLKYEINKAKGALYDFSDFIQGSILKVVNRPIALLSGPAGIGKSHLLADIASNRINAKKSCILLLGQKFRSEESPWTQILRNLLRLNCNETQLLGALEARAQAQGERLLFLVDAINEGKGRYFWPEHIRGFVKEFSKYPWIGLVLSVRSSYEKLLVPDNFIENTGITKISHFGFDGIEYQSARFFFSQYGIEQPSVPLLNPEFKNPLFLKLFCEGLHRSGLTNVPKGYGGISSIVDFFIQSIDEKLSTPSFFDYPSGQKIIRKVIDRLIEFKLDNKLSTVPYEKAFELADQIISQFSNARRFLDALISEGVFAKNLFLKENGEFEEGIYLAYERFEDHLTVAYLLDRTLPNTPLDEIFREKGRLFRYIEDSGFTQGLLESLAIQIPERTGKELYELVDDGKKDDTGIIDSFINSLIWRKPETIKETSIEYVNKYVFRYKNSFDLFFQMVYSVATDPEHFYNADSLHRYLMQFTMAVRDASWTINLHDQDYQGSSMPRLIDWAKSEEDKFYLSSESRLLAAKALTWLFTSTNISFRDSATKALVVLLENSFETIKTLLVEFEKVDDPYVYERIFAAAYGGVLRSQKIEGLEDLSHYIIEKLFKADEVYPNILVRDYARNIVEYAIHRKCITLENIEIIRPPYRSSFPSAFPSNDEIDAYEFDYKNPDFKDYYWGQNSILSSMVTEYGRGVCMYGDFGRYTFQSALYDWENFNPNDLSNYACKLIFEKYGYDVEKHGKFDRHATSGDRHTNKRERIGKKYQWIALYEVLARVSDNFQMVDEYTRWSEDKHYVWYQGPWQPFVRNIDPTVVHHQRKVSQDSMKFGNSGNNIDMDDTHENWLFSHQNLPDPVSVIYDNATVNSDWLVLKRHLSWEESVPIGKDDLHFPRKHLWYHIRSYLVKEDEYDSIIHFLQDQQFSGDWLHERNDRYQVFSREFFWSPAYQFFKKPYYDGGDWDEVNDPGNRSKVIGHVLPTSEGYRWQSGADYESQPSFLAPCEIFYLYLNLQYSKNMGEWLSKEGQVVCFDPSVGKGGPSALNVQKTFLQQFLSGNNLKIFWTCFGEKNIYGTSFSGTRFPRGLELSGIYTLNNGQIEGEIKYKCPSNSQ
ncbi:hypothetical protein ACTRXD_09710 [Nitrospira sp. T9]|uniref:hypothetical protein n=1 Tax=unclassified Nitrospira TaxID=2652172 RepID=UPI003F98B946